MRKASEKIRKPSFGSQLLFVYGTLMRGGRLHRHLNPGKDAKYVGEAKIRAELYRLQGKGYPGATVTTRLDRFVHGELYALRDPERLLERIDEIEGCAEGLFVRRLVDILQNDRKMKGWTYFYARSVSSAEPLPDGRFLPVHAVA